jgi:hypothetical protein
MGVIASNDARIHRGCGGIVQINHKKDYNRALIGRRIFVGYSYINHGSNTK